MIRRASATSVTACVVSRRQCTAGTVAGAPISRASTKVSVTLRGRAAKSAAGRLWLTGRAISTLQYRKASTAVRSEEHTSELQSLMRISYAVFCLKKKKTKKFTYQDK